MDIKLASIDPRLLHIHAHTCEEDDRLESHKKRAIKVFLELIAYHFNLVFSPDLDFVLELSDPQAMKSYCVLGLFQDRIRLLSNAEALAETDEAINVHCNVNCFLGEKWQISFRPVYIRYEYSFLRRMQTCTSFTGSTAEPEAANIRISRDRGRRDQLLDPSPDSNTSVYTAIPTPYGLFTIDEVCRTPVSRFQEIFPYVSTWLSY